MHIDIDAGVGGLGALDKACRRPRRNLVERRSRIVTALRPAESAMATKPKKSHRRIWWAFIVFIVIVVIASELVQQFKFIHW